MRNLHLLQYTIFTLPSIIAIYFFLLLSIQAEAGYVGPQVIAKIDRNFWPELINTPDSFDKASRASILLYTLTLQHMQKLSDLYIQASLKVKSLNRTSVDKWLNKELELSLLNYKKASETCVMSDWTCIDNVTTFDDLLKKAKIWSLKIPYTFLVWRDHLNSFSYAYVSEQLRLAALFPKVSSEIDLFNDNELNGDTLKDRQFFITFDDGPSSLFSRTQDTINMLDENMINAVFFLLGKNLQEWLNKNEATNLVHTYRNQCVASHGWEHQSHATWYQWQDSVKRTQSLINSTFSKKNILPLFRPPYGQRKADSGNFFQSQSLQVVLWSLDSQDWSVHIDANEIINRMVTLILIKRHGILLFHDIYHKAKLALPVIFNKLGNAIKWDDCHSIISSNISENFSRDQKTWGHPLAGPGQ